MTEPERHQAATSNSRLSRCTEGKENATGFHRGAIDKLWEALRDNDLVSSTDTREKNRDAKKLQMKRAAAEKWRLLSESSFHQQTLYPPQHVCPHPPSRSLSPGYPRAPAEAQALRGGPFSSVSGQGSSVTPGPTPKVHFQGHLLIHTRALSFLQPHYTELHGLSTPTPEHSFLS